MIGAFLARIRRYFAVRGAALRVLSIRNRAVGVTSESKCSIRSATKACQPMCAATRLTSCHALCDAAVAADSASSAAAPASSRTATCARPARRICRANDVCVPRMCASRCSGAANRCWSAAPVCAVRRASMRASRRFAMRIRSIIWSGRLKYRGAVAYGRVLGELLARTCSAARAATACRSCSFRCRSRHAAIASAATTRRSSLRIADREARWTCRCALICVVRTARNARAGRARSPSNAAAISAAHSP